MTQFSAGISVSSRASLSSREAARRALEAHERYQGAAWALPFDRDAAQIKLLARHHSAPQYRGASFVLRVGGVK